MWFNMEINQWQKSLNNPLHFIVSGYTVCPSQYISKHKIQWLCFIWYKCRVMIPRNTHLGKMFLNKLGLFSFYSVIQVYIEDRLSFDIDSTLLASHRCVLNNNQQEIFGRLARHCNKFAKLIPMSFVLGESLNVLTNATWCYQLLRFLVLS